MHLGIPYNGADLGLTIGEAGGQYQDSTARASSQTLNPGILTLISNLRVCNRTTLPPSVLPKPLEADTDASGGQPVSRSTSGQVGSQSVSAAPNADGTGEGTGLGFGIPGLVEVSNGKVHAEARWDPARQVRTVTSTVDLGTLSLLKALPLGGVQLGGLRWVLQQVVAGADSRSSNRTVTSLFTVGSAKAFGLALPVPAADKAQQLFDRINALSAPFGLQPHAPKLVPDGEFGLSFTPLTVSLGGKTLFGPILAPLLGGATVNQIERALSPGIFDTRSCNELFGLLNRAPQFNAVWNGLGAAAPIVIGALAAAVDGQAGVDISLGNARVSIDDTYYPFNPGSYGGPVTNPGGTPVSSGGASGGGTGTVGGIAGTPGAAGPATGAVALAGPVRAPTSGTTTFAKAGRVHCETTSPVGWPGCWRGNAPMAAGVAGVLTLGLLAADEVFRRRRLAATTKEVAD
jgi:hypothetical protein